MLLKLKKLDIEDKEWVKAMDIIDESIFVKVFKMPLRFSSRNTDDPEGGWSEFILNFNDIPLATE
jgi:hypothetical protein